MRMGTYQCLTAWAPNLVLYDLNPALPVKSSVQIQGAGIVDHTSRWKACHLNPRSLPSGHKLPTVLLVEK